MSKSITAILNGISYRSLGSLPTTISELSLNSQELSKGMLFFAIRGAKDDGHRYVQNAIQNGAAAVVVEVPVIIDSIPQIIVADTKIALSRAAANFYDDPTKNMQVVGVTGTNGKTTTVYLLNEIFKSAGIRPGTVGTLGYSIENERYISNLTTPDSIRLQQIFYDMAMRQVEAAAMEVSSHSLALHRVDDVHFKVGVFTNISQDHLDFHATLEAYANAKSKLFGLIETGGFVVNNLDDEYADLFRQQARVRIVNYALQKKADFSWAPGVAFSNGIHGKIITPGGAIEIDSPLSGEFNLKNILAATAVAVNLKIDT
ncbi:MAG: UDP-N-acetylmuramyl-tripeptide synthetase, partial [Candidatus Neomarinimicrobiota bacterium]